MISITIGRNINNDIRFNHPSVSGFHAEIIVFGDKIEMIDKQSANGTYLNGMKISRALLKNTDDLLFGEYIVTMKTFLFEINKVYNEKKTDFSKEYKDTLLLFSIYQRAKDKIIHPPQWPLYTRISLTILAMIILMFTKIVPPQYTIYVMMSVGLFSMAPSLFSPSQSKKNDLLDHLKLTYEDQLVCPKCKYKMTYQNLAYWRGKRSCVNDKCNAEF